jgi:hypothetical protein
MSRRVLALMVLAGVAAIPTASDAAQPDRVVAPTVSVKPRAGSARTHFVVSFGAAHATGRFAQHHYRITASERAHGGCQSDAAAAPATEAGATVRVVLAPSGSKHWCAGLFRGQVWDVITLSCPVGKACPAIEPLPHMVGKFTFRVTRG